MRLTRTAALVAALVPLAAATAAAQTGPAWAATHLPADVLSLACAPSAVSEVPAVPLRVTGGQSLEARISAAPSELITINAGSANGIQVGQEFFVRRFLKDRDQIVSRETPGTVHTAGWIRVYAVDETMSLATIVYALRRRARRRLSRAVHAAGGGAARREEGQAGTRQLRPRAARQGSAPDLRRRRLHRHRSRHATTASRRARSSSSTTTSTRTGTSSTRSPKPWPSRCARTRPR